VAGRGFIRTYVCSKIELIREYLLRRNLEAFVVNLLMK